MTIEATASARVSRGPLFSGLRLNRDRYTVTLWIDEIETPLHVHCSRRELKKVSRNLTDNANELLNDFGYVNEVYAKLNPIPATGTLIELTERVGTWAAGSQGNVIDCPWQEDIQKQFPVAFQPLNTEERMPLKQGEWKVVL